MSKYSQADLDFWLASFVQRGRDHTPQWVTVSKLLRLGANTTVSPMGHRGMRLPSPIATCQEMVEAYDPDHGRMLQGWNCSPARARQICANTQKYFQGCLDQFAKAGFLTKNLKFTIHGDEYETLSPFGPRRWRCRHTGRTALRVGQSAGHTICVTNDAIKQLLKAETGGAL